MEKEERRIVPPPMPISNVFPIETDPFGSYSGISLDRFDKPVQDADDL